MKSLTLRDMREATDRAHDVLIVVPHAPRKTMTDVIVTYRMTHGSSRSDLLMRRQYAVMPLRDLRSLYEGLCRMLHPYVRTEA